MIKPAKFSVILISFIINNISFSQNTQNYFQNYVKADSIFKEKDYKTALVYYTRLFYLIPSNPLVNYRLAQIYSYVGEKLNVFKYN